MTDPDQRRESRPIRFPTATRLRRLVQVAVLLLVCFGGTGIAMLTGHCEERHLRHRVPP